MLRSLPSFLSLALIALPYYAYSFCVYNKHSDDTFLEARQYKFQFGFHGAFRKLIYRDGRECCSYTNSDCNPNAGDPNTVIKLYISRINVYELGHFSVTLPAGGWVVVDGDKEHHTVAVKWADGRSYDETIIEYGASWVARVNETET